MIERKLIDEIKRLTKQQDIIEGFFNGSSFIASNGTRYNNLILTTYDPGQAFIVKYQDKWLCIVNSSNELIRTNIIVDRRAKYNPILLNKPGYLLYLYKTPDGLFINNNSEQIQELELPSFSINFGYIHNYGKKVNYDISLNSTFASDKIVNYRNNTSFVYDKLTQPYDIPDTSGTFSISSIYYKGNLKYLTNNIVLTKYKNNYTELDFIDGCSISYTENWTNNTASPFYINSGTLLTNFIGETINDTCTEVSTSANTDVVITSNNFFQYLDYNNLTTTEGLETIDNIIIRGNIDGNSFDFNSNINTNFGTVTFNGNYLKENLNDSNTTINFSLSNYVMCWKDNYIYIEESNSSITQIQTNYFETFEYDINRNYNFYLKNELTDSTIVLDTSPSLYITSQTPLVIDQNTTSLIISTSFSQDYKINNNAELELIGQNVYIAKKETTFTWLLSGTIINISVEVSPLANTIYKIICEVKVNNIDRRKYVSFSSNNGSLLTNNGSIFSYLQLSGIVPKQNIFDFTSGFYSLEYPTQQIASTQVKSSFELEEARSIRFRLDPATNILNILSTDNLVKNTIYRSSIPDFREGGKRKVFIEKWKVTSTGKIIYDGLIEEIITNVPSDSILYSSSYYPE